METEVEEKIPVVIDDNPDLGYEKTAGWFYYFLFLPIMFFTTAWVAIKKMIFGKNLKTNTFWFDGLSPTCREMKENAMRWKALDIAYNHKFAPKIELTPFLTLFGPIFQIIIYF